MLEGEARIREREKVKASKDPEGRIPARQGYVYFFRAGNTVKIGFSSDVRERAHSLSVGCPEPGFVCKIMTGTMARERDLHARFAEYRIKGEWFELRGRLAKYLERHIRPCSYPDPVPAHAPARVEEFSL